MSIILIDVHLLGVSASHYYIGNHSQELYEYLVNKSLFQFDDSFRIIGIKIVEDLKPYREVFDFEGDSFSTLWNKDISDSIIRQFLKDKNTILISEIFKIYNILDPDFSAIFREKYLEYLNIHGTVVELQEFNNFLSQWLNYLQYAKHLIYFRPINAWDCNLNNILDMYLNPVPYVKTADKYFFILNNLEPNNSILKIPVQKSLNCHLLPLDRNFHEVINCDFRLLKFINDYNSNKIYL